MLLLFGIVAVLAGLSHGKEVWNEATATWFGEAEGYGTSGGACGYGALGNSTGYGRNVSAGSSPLFMRGRGCGGCFQVKCVDRNRLCSSDPVTVTIIDECPGGDFCGGNRTHFDLSGTAFGNMAAQGRENELRAVSIVQVMYKRVPCRYVGYNMTFTIDSGSNDMWLSFVIEYQPGDGDASSVALQETGNSEWKSMTHNWGANWHYLGHLVGPLSVRISSRAGEVLVASNCIPDKPEPGATYVSALKAS